MNNPKDIERNQLLEFFRAAKIAPQALDPHECPDFIAVIEGKTIGIELTTARHEVVKFGAIQIEHAQSMYARGLKKCLEYQAKDSGVGMAICFAFEDGVPVEKKDTATLPELAQCVFNIAASLPDPGSITIWAEEVARRRKDAKMGQGKRETSAPLPEFIQNVCVIRDNVSGIKVLGGRGGILPDFDDSVLLPILESKNKRLKRYETCDQSWLVIVSGVSRFEGHSPDEELPELALPSFATNFGKVTVTKPIPSDFDETYLFKLPFHVMRLSEN
ncbi:hypothetical protein [Poseidonocella sp. HB161398]|uniref:hypothetical protein n=1 Tax=Poseidonocella sp. HB161398 TaxID=2320855 RepID=UPI00110959A1|nr:hypothetical protein [Poseidonocella sp. HB161398]